MKTSLNYYKNTKNPVVLSATTSQDWFSYIKKSEFSELIESARSGDEDYNTVKLTKIPCVTYNFLYDSYKKDINIISSTGLLYLDIDNPSFDIRSIDRSKIYALYHSFGGYGWSLIVRIDGLNKKNFKYNYKLIVKELGLEEYIDINAIKASQYNVLSYDPNIQINNSSKVFIAQEEELTIKCTPSVCNKKEEEKAYTHGGGTLLKPLRFDNLNDLDFEGDYTVNWEGYDWVRCWIPIKKVTVGRNNLLLSYCNNLVWLNPHITIERALKVIKSVNQIAFLNPLDNLQLNRIVSSIFKYKDDGSLQPILFERKRKIVFKKNSGLNAQEKREIVLELCNKKKADDSMQKLYNIIEQWDFDIYGKISIRKISNNFPISKKTVAKYWSEFKEYVNELNK